MIEKKLFGKTPSGEEINCFTLTNSKGMKVEILDYGCIIMSILVPDKEGKFADVALGYGDVDTICANPGFMGAAIGRYANRIEDARFCLNGKEYPLFKNDGNNHLHGGKKGFDKYVWSASIEGDSLSLTHTSPDGDEGYPNNLHMTIVYTLTEDMGLSIQYLAHSDGDTPINLTNHSYFNLDGHDAGDILDHEIQIEADFYTPVDSECIPTGEILTVKGTPFDFTGYKTIGRDIAQDNQQLKNGGGYDHNFVLRREQGGMLKAATVYSKKSGRVMEVITNKPGVQLYTGNSISTKPTHKSGKQYGKRAGLCLETQFFPNSVKFTYFPTPILKKGETYDYTTIYRFSVR